MGAHLSIRELAGVGLPIGQRDGIFAMLRAYFDDSGTHSDSEVVVVGGLIGTVEQWNEFERQWIALLENPLPGTSSRPDKPPLKMFHLAACNANEGEFADYNEAEQNAVTYAFRKVLIDTKLTSTASAIDRKAWDELVIGPYRDELGDALSVCVENCVLETIRIAGPHIHGRNVAVVFDRGVMSARVQQITEPFTYPLGRPRIVSVNFSKVVDTPSLQGADIVATESYWQGIKVLRQGIGAQPRAHFRHYLDNMLTEGLILDREAILGELRRRGPDGKVLPVQPS